MRFLGVFVFVALSGCTGLESAEIHLDGTEMHYAPSSLTVVRPNGGDWGLVSMDSDHAVQATLDGETIRLGDGWQTFAEGPMRAGDRVTFCVDEPAWTVVLRVGSDRSEGSLNVRMEAC